MKISCVALNSNLINNVNQTKTIDFLSNKLYEIGETFSLISYFDNNYEKLKNIIDSDYQIMFFIGTNETMYNYNVKSNLAKVFGDKLENNQTSYITLKKYCDNNNMVFSVLEESEVMLPKESIPLVSDDYPMNGFMYKYNNKYIIFLPSNLYFTKINYFSYILPLINDILGIKKEYQIIKCFGILEKDIKNLLSEYYAIQDLNIYILSDYLDNTIYIRYNANMELTKIQNIISNIITKLNKFIYSLEDVNIYQMAHELLSIQNKSLSIGETITLGNLTKELTEIDFKNIITSNIYINNKIMFKELDINSKIIEQYGEYSVNTVYELDNALLEKYGADIAIFTLGDIENKDICYIAVGDIEGIHVYKNKINLYDKDYLKTLTKTATFYLIKKLKQNSLQFS